jgi:hypothetical protein
MHEPWLTMTTTSSAGRRLVEFKLAERDSVRFIPIVRHRYRFYYLRSNFLSADYSVWHARPCHSARWLQKVPKAPFMYFNIFPIESQACRGSVCGRHGSICPLEHLTRLAGDRATFDYIARN